MPFFNNNLSKTYNTNILNLFIYKIVKIINKIFLKIILNLYLNKL